MVCLFLRWFFAKFLGWQKVLYIVAGVGSKTCSLCFCGHCSWVWTWRFSGASLFRAVRICYTVTASHDTLILNHELDFGTLTNLSSVFVQPSNRHFRWSRHLSCQNIERLKCSNSQDIWTTASPYMGGESWQHIPRLAFCVLNSLSILYI